MRNFLCIVTFTLSIIVSLVSSASLLDLLWDNQDETTGNRNGDEKQSTCICKGPSCMCCVDFNLTIIDLGGPGCVQMKYISQQEGVNVNVSYGENLLHSKQVKGPNPEPTCMTLLANIAQICATFSELIPSNDGLKGCLMLEPRLLGESATSFNIGCFTMGPEGMKVDKISNPTKTPTITATDSKTNNTQTDGDEFNEEDVLAIVNETAQNGLTYLGNLLGISFKKAVEPDGNNNTAVITTTDSTVTKIR